MKKNCLFSLAAITALCSYAYYNSSRGREGISLVNANIEALTYGESKTCTRPKVTCNCWGPNFNYGGIAILSVEEYQPSSIMDKCDPVQVTNCPSNTRCTNYHYYSY